MSNSTTVSFDLGTTSPGAGLGFEVWLDDNKLYDNIVDFESKKLSFDLEDSDGEHQLRFIMKNKTSEHTQLDESGNIVTDAKLSLSDLSFDEIKLGQIFIDQTEYAHNFNGTGEDTKQKFYGSMGCNGTVTLNFSTPIYLWLLENM